VLIPPRDCGLRFGALISGHARHRYTSRHVAFSFADAHTFHSRHSAAVIHKTIEPYFMSRSSQQKLPQPRADLAFFLDVDGTLLPIAETPDAVSPSVAVCSVLINLAAASNGAVALVSGRPLAELDQLFPENRFPAAGQHGAERRDTFGNITRAEPHAPALDALRDFMRRLAGSDARLMLEDKGLSLALHYRRAPQLGPVLTTALKNAVTAHPEISLQPGKQVLEVRPATVSKAHAVRSFMSEPPFLDRTPVFVGDDITDEDGFAMVNSLRGISIKVGSGHSVAKYRLADTAAVLHWLAACVPAHPAREMSSNAQS
jgi:trehalose 6-phosphate phosphatase